MNVYIIRHTAPDVPQGTCYGQTDVPLKETFKTEARAVKDSIPDITFDAVYSSPLSRCRFLADYCGFRTPRLDNRLKELNFGRWEMLRYDEIDDPYIQEWYDNFVDAPIPGGESFREMYRRILHTAECWPAPESMPASVTCVTPLRTSSPLAA